VRKADPRYRAHQAATERRRELTTSLADLSKEDRKMFAFLHPEEAEKGSLGLREEDEEEDEGDYGEEVDQKGEKEHPRQEKKHATVEESSATTAKKAAPASKTKNKSKYRDNFTRGQLQNEAPKQTSKSAKNKNKQEAQVLLEGDARKEKDVGGDAADGQVGVKDLKDPKGKDRKEKELQDFDDAIVCPTCGMDFTSEKKRQEHYKKFPDHDPARIAEAKRLAAQQRSEEEGGTKEKGNNKPKQKRHGHRKF